MQRFGAHDLSPFMDHYLGDLSDGGSESTWTAPLDNLAWYLTSTRATADLARRDDAADAVPVPDGGIGRGTPYGSAVRHCSSSQSIGTSDRSKALGTDELSAQLQQELDVVEAKLGGDGSYDACMSEHDVDLGESAVTGYAGLLEYLDRSQPAYRQIPPLDSADASKEWQSYVALARSAFDADHGCRVDAHAEAMTMLQPQLDSFSEANDHALHNVAREWDRIVSEALASGWRPMRDAG